MAKEVRWGRLPYESRIDDLASEVEGFVDAVLRSIDADAARASPAQWSAVCEFFAGCAEAARQQSGTALRSGEGVANYLEAAFPAPNRFPRGCSRQGYFEFMDWLSKPQAFRPTRLRNVLADS